MFGDQGQSFLTAGQHALLTADFRASGIDPDAFGFYDQLGFLARESTDPAYLARYAQWVLTRPMSPEYEAHVRATVPKLAHLLSAAFAAHDAHGRCLAACSMMTRMLDLLHVWSFGLFGSVVLEVPDQGLRRTMRTIAFKRDPDPDAAAGHAWVCAPPFLVVDTTLALQRWDAAILSFLPGVVLADAAAPRVHARVEDIVDDRVRDLFADAEGRRDPYLHHRLDPSLRGFHQTFPAREITIPSLNLRFVPVLIHLPAERLKHIGIKRGGPSGQELWNSIVAPAFGLALLP
jgi:hypothetical protein